MATSDCGKVKAQTILTDEDELGALTKVKAAATFQTRYRLDFLRKVTRGNRHALITKLGGTAIISSLNNSRCLGTFFRLIHQHLF